MFSRLIFGWRGAGGYWLDYRASAWAVARVGDGTSGQFLIGRSGRNRNISMERQTGLASGMGNSLSLTPGFSPVTESVRRQNRFNGLSGAGGKPLKRFWRLASAHTGLKPGVNERTGFISRRGISPGRFRRG